MLPRSKIPLLGIGTVHSIALVVVTVVSALAATPKENVIAPPDLLATKIFAKTIVPPVVGAVYTVVAAVVFKLLLANNPDGDGMFIP